MAHGNEVSTRIITIGTGGLRVVNKYIIWFPTFPIFGFFVFRFFSMSFKVVSHFKSARLILSSPDCSVNLFYTTMVVNKGTIRFIAGTVTCKTRSVASVLSTPSITALTI